MPKTSKNLPKPLLHSKVNSERLALVLGEKPTRKTPVLRAYLNARKGRPDHKRVSLTLQFTYRAANPHKFQPGISLPPVLWDGDKQEIKVDKDLAIGYSLEQGALRRQRERFQKFITGACTLFDEKVRGNPALLNGTKEVKRLNAWDCLAEFEAEERARASIANYLEKNINKRFTRGPATVAKDTVRKRQTLITQLREFERTQLGRPFTAADLSRTGRDWFCEFLYATCDGRNEARPTATTINKALKQIKAVAEQLRSEPGVEINPFVWNKVEWLEFEAGQTGRYPAVSAEELQALVTHAQSEKERRVADGFLLCTHLGVRWKDYLQIHPEAFDKPYLFRYIEAKGRKAHMRELVIPVSPPARGILERYGYACPTGQMRGQVFSRALKAVARRAELDRPCPMRYAVQGGELKLAERPLYEAITHHSARVTCVTNLRGRGFTPEQVAAQTGHAVSKTIVDRYDRSEAAKKAERAYIILYGELPG